MKLFELAKKLKLKDKTYDALKWIALIALPASASLYAALAPIWTLPYAEEIPKTIYAIDTFLGILLGVSTVNYNRTKKV